MLRSSLALSLLPIAVASSQRWEYDGRVHRYAVEVVASDFSVPFGMAFLPDGRLLVSDRPRGQLSILDVQTGRRTNVGGVPAVYDSLDAGLLDVIVHPDFRRNALVYYAYVENSDSGSTTVVERARLENNQLVARQRLFAAFPALRSVNHFGARLLLTNGYLYITLGERDIRELAQELWTDHGKVIRLFEDGRVPPDNPFVGRPSSRPGIWSYGHRNPHGLALHPVTGELWESEHGPLGGDEINIIKRGANYGWPLVTFGREYEGHAISSGRTERAGLEQPVHHYASSAALSGTLFYTGSAFPQWQNSLFVGLMTPRYLGRLMFDGTTVRQEPLLLEQRWRVRSIQQGPDGFIYVGIERSARTATDGKVVRIRPAG